MAAAEYRLGVGTLSTATIEGSSSYLLENFTVQSDQISALIHPWGPPSDEGTTYPRFARYVIAADLSQRADGFIEFNWVLPYLTEGMLSYIEAQIWGSAQSALVTAKTRKSNGVFDVYNATALRPIPDEHYERGYKGVENYLIRFVGGSEAA